MLVAYYQLTLLSNLHSSFANKPNASRMTEGDRTEQDREILQDSARRSELKYATSALIVHTVDKPKFLMNGTRTDTTPTSFPSKLSALSPCCECVLSVVL